MRIKTDVSDDEQSSYRQIIRVTSIFGGVQVFNIILSIIRSKLIAVLLGPAGMGIAGLLTTSTGFISSLTNFGLGTSAVRDIAAANASDDENRISHVITVFRRLVWITGILGAIVTLVLSPWLSQLSFGNKDYTIPFVWLSLTLLFNQLTSGQNVLLQGMRKLQYLAKANMLGSVAGLMVSVPFYYFLGLRGIVPALILTSVLTLSITWFFSKKISVAKVLVSRKQTLLEGSGMLRMGFILSLSSLITIGASYIVRVFISNSGKMADVGLYNAGFAIISTYVSLIFSAMGTDYYPRLSAVAHDKEKVNVLISHQAEVAILILAPILCIFLIFINWIVILLYSDKFSAVNGMIHWAALGMYFKAASWSIAFILIAKGDSKTFFWNELIANTYVLLFNILGYKLMGLNGLGISFMIAYILYLFQVFFLAKRKYQFSFSLGFYKIFLLQFLLGLLCFIIVKIMSIYIAYIFGSIIICISLWVSYTEMNRRIGLKNFMMTLKLRK